MKQGRNSRWVVCVGTVLVLSQAAGAHNICGSVSNPSTAEKVQCAIDALELHGFYDGPMSATITAGSETATFDATGMADLITKFNTLYPDTTLNANGTPNPSGTTMTQKFTKQYFPTIFGTSGATDLALHPALFTTYPLLNTAPITASATLDGVTISLSAAANSNTVVIDAPKAGIHQSFTGTSRYDALQNLSGYMHTNGSDILNSLHNAIAANSAVDPVIGNPQSFVQQLASTTYEFGTTIGEADPAQTKSQVGAPHLDPAFSMSMEPQYFAADGVDGVAVHVPLDYTWFLSDPRYAITLDVPLNFVRQNSTDAISGAIGLGVRIPLTDHWYVTPQAHFGAVVSLDRGPFGVGDYGSVIYTLGARSKYNFFVYDDTIKFSIINSFGYYKSLDVKLKQYTLDPKISTRIYSNGLSAETASDITMFGAPTAWSAYAQDNRISGTQSLITGWEEFGVSLGTTGRMTKQSWESFQIGISVALGDSNYRAVQLNVVTQF